MLLLGNLSEWGHVLDWHIIILGGALATYHGCREPSGRGGRGDVEDIRDEVSQAAARLDDIGIILPPDPWEAEPETLPPGDVILRSGLVVTTRPGIR